MEIISKLYNYNTHIDSNKENAISVTTLISGLYRAKKYLNKDAKDENLIDLKFKRSSTIGTGLHLYAEQCFKDDPDYRTELYREREITVDGKVYVISGSSDLLIKKGDEWEIADWKTAYGTSRKDDQLAKDKLQMSIYRWLLEDEYTITERGWTLAISQSNNWQDEIPIELLSYDQVVDYIENKIYAIESQKGCDCHDTKFKLCDYCSYVNCEERK